MDRHRHLLKGAQNQEAVGHRLISVQREGGFALDKVAGYVVDTVMRVAVDGIDQVSCRAPSRTCRLVSSLMRGLLCSALDAVAVETPANAATSSSRAARPVAGWVIMPRFLGSSAVYSALFCDEIPHTVWCGIASGNNCSFNAKTFANIFFSAWRSQGNCSSAR